MDPPDVDNNGHGTHVAGIIAAAANDFGISGVAPGVSLVNLHAGQDAGYFFLQPVVEALTYAADQGINVVNMSFYVDPWLMNCDRNPDDSPREQAQQRIVKMTMTRAMAYAHARGVVMVVAFGNEHTDNSHHAPDVASPDWPLGSERTRQVDPATCGSMPADDPYAINVSAIGPSGAKADYSTYGLKGISVAAPGGYRNDGYGTPSYRSKDNLITSTFSASAAQEAGWVTPTGDVTEAGAANGIVKAGKDGNPAYYYPAQGTSMAAPVVAGIAGLIISQYGQHRGDRVRMDADAVQRRLEGTATPTPCPTPRTVDYTPLGRPADWTATCEDGPGGVNGFYGHGVVDAWRAVTQDQWGLAG
ncbi:hypothetical protein GCM10029964_092520 [Kibdelosporangium lantanae]